MTKIFEQEFEDGSQLWCHIQNDNYTLGHLGSGKSNDLFWSLRDNESISDYIKDNFLCPNDFCQNGYIDIGYGEKMMCAYCNLI